MSKRQSTTQQSKHANEQTDKTPDQEPEAAKGNLPVPALLLQRAVKNPNSTTLTPAVVRSMQSTHGNQFVMRLLNRPRTSQLKEGQGAETIQRTLADAKRYARSHKELSVYDVNSRHDVETIASDTRVSLEARQALINKYNNNLTGEEPIPLPTGGNAPAPAQAAVVTAMNYATFWSAGEFGAPLDNANGHFQKHVMRQGEFPGQYASVVEYTQGALEFSKDSRALEDVQKGGNFGRYFYDSSTKLGKMVVLNGENGRLTSYYQLRGTPKETAIYVAEKLGKSGNGWMEVLESFNRLVQPTPAPASIPISTSITAPMTEAVNPLAQYTAGFFTVEALQQHFPQDVLANLSDTTPQGAILPDNYGGRWQLTANALPHQVSMIRQ